MSPLASMRTRPRLWASAALVTAGLAGGAVLGTTMSAGASTTGTSTGSAATSSAATGTNGTNGTAPTPPNGQAPAPPDGRAFPGLPNSGTVTAVGSSSVTIDGKTYAVTSSSDIDKNGEATLSDLAVGDKVTFSTVTSASTPTIDKLHAGNEALDRPSGPPGGNRPDKPGAPPRGSGPAA